MIVSWIHNNKIGAYAFMLLLIILFGIRPIIEKSIGISFNENSMPLWHIFSFAKNNLWLGYIFSIIATIIIALNTTRFNSKYALLSKQSALPGVIFVLIVCGIPKAQHFSPIWITSILVIISLEHLFTAYHLRKTMKECFLASFWLSISSLFFYKALLLIPLLFIIMTTLRVSSFKSLLASIIGIILPWLFTFAYYIITKNTNAYFEHLNFTFNKIVQYFSHSTFSIIFLVTIVFLFIVALFSIFGEYGKKKIFTRKQYQVFIFSGIYISLLMVITGINIELIPLLAFPYAITISHLIDHIRSWVWQNIILIWIFIVAILGQVFL